jgi:hypothetical protein
MNFAAVASILSAAFAVVVGLRWWRSRVPSFACWALGLTIVALAAGSQSLGEHYGFQDHVTLFRLFYLLGGALGVVYLALGTIYLSAPRRLARVVTVVLLVYTVATAIDAFIAPVNAAKLDNPAGILGGAFHSIAPPIQVALVTFNILGAEVFAGGAAWSAWRFIRDRAGMDRIACNVLLTAGALLITAGISAAKITNGSLDTLGAYEAGGVAVMFAGFLCLGWSRLAAVGRSTLPTVATGAR